MPQQIDHIVILGSTLTALALVRHCRSLGLACDVVDTKAGPAAASAIPKVTLLRKSTGSETLDSVKALARPKRSALVADSDAWLRWVTSFRAELETEFEEILHPSNEVAATCLDKSAFLRWCQRNDLPVPRLYSISDSRDLRETTYPVLVRPTETRHGVPSNLPKAVEIQSDAELELLLAQYESEGAYATICESLLRPRVKQFSVGVVRNRSGNVRAIVAEKVRPPADWCAGGTYVVTSHDDEVHELAVSAANKIDLFGIAEVEILRDEDSQELFLIEINPRPWVQYSLAWRSGFDFLTFILTPQSYSVENETKSGRRWICFKDDAYVALSRSGGMVRRQEVTVRQYCSDLLRANVYAYWSIVDPQPWLRKVAERFDKTHRS